MEALKHNERPEIPVETLMTSIRRVEDAFKTAYEAGHRAFQLQNKDRDIAALYNESLAGCSDQSFNLVVFPLQSALEVLHNFEGVLEAWAGKAKRMKFVRGLLEKISTDQTLSRAERLIRIKYLLNKDVGRIETYYARGFSTYKNEIEPVISALSSVQNFIANVSTELGINLVGEEESGSDTDSNQSTSGMSDSSHDSQATIRPPKAQSDYESESVSMQMSDSDSSSEFFNEYLSSGGDWFGPLLEDVDNLDGAADDDDDDDLLEDLNLAATGRAPPSSPVAAAAADSVSTTSSLTSLSPAPRHPTPHDSSSSTALDLAPKRNTMYPAKRRRRSPLLQIDPGASAVDRVYIVANHLINKCIRQAKVLLDMAVDFGALAMQMAGYWREWANRVQSGEAKLERKRKERLEEAYKREHGNHRRGSEQLEQEQEESVFEDYGMEFFDAGMRVGPKVDSSKCGYL